MLNCDSAAALGGMASSSVACPSPAHALLPLPANTGYTTNLVKCRLLGSGSSDQCSFILVGSRGVSPRHCCPLQFPRFVVEAGLGVNSPVRDVEDVAEWVARKATRRGENFEVEVVEELSAEKQEDDDNTSRDVGTQGRERWGGLKVMPNPSNGGSAQGTNSENMTNWRWVKGAKVSDGANSANQVPVADMWKELQETDTGTKEEFLYVDDDFVVDSGNSAVTVSGEEEAKNLPAEYRPLPINLDLKLYQGRRLRRKGQYAEAEAILRQLIKEWPGDGRPYVLLAKTLMVQRKFQEARIVFENGCQAVSGENPYIWQAWACLEDSLGQSSKARQLFDAATVADKKHAAAWHGWAVLELREGNTKKAVSLLNRGLRFCRPNEYIHQSLALIEARAKDYDAARANFAKATEINTKSAASWVAWAAMEAELDRPTAARRLFQKALEASPKNRYVWQTWGIFEADQGNRDRARELFQRGSELNPKDPVLLQAWSLFEYKCCGSYKAASELFQRAVTLDPRHQPVWVAWGWMEAKQGNMNAARELFKRAILVDSRSMDAIRSYQAWGVMEERDGNYGVARELFKSALKVDSQNVPTWMAWAAMEERLENFVRADELRNLCLQQRTEVVEGISWNVDNIADLLAPAIDKLKGLFSLDWSSKQEKEPPAVDTLDAVAGDSSTVDEFDITAFLKKTFPWRYMTDETGTGSARAYRVANRQDLMEQEEEL